MRVAMWAMDRGSGVIWSQSRHGSLLGSQGQRTGGAVRMRFHGGVAKGERIGARTHTIMCGGIAG